MKTKFYLFLIVFAMYFSTAQSQFSTVGTEFWLSFHENFNTADPILYITSSQGSTGVVSIPGMGWTYNFTVGVNQSVTVELPVNAIITQTNSVLNMAVHVTATDPVAVYAANERSASSDATLVFPINRLGDNYRVNVYTPLNAGNPSQFVVVGTQDNTSIEIIPTANINGGVTAGTPFNITLNTGQVYFVTSSGDLTGTIVRATSLGECNDFAVFAGNKCANVPTCTFCDHLYEQMIPTKAWGQEYITTPLLTRNGDQYRIMALEDNTVININNGPNINLNAGNFHEVYLQPASFIVGDKPISVAQYARGTNCDGADADPFMIMLSPAEQVIDYIVFHAFQTGYIQNFYTNIISKTEHTNLVLFDGAPVTGWNTVPANPDYSYARLSLTAGTYAIESPEGILATAYGFGNVQSYGYLAGANMEPLDVDFSVIVENDSIPYNEFTDSLGCEQSVNGVEFYTNGEGISDVSWDLGDGTIVEGNSVSHVYQNPGTYTVIMYFMREQSCAMDSLWVDVHISDDMPPIDFLNDTIVCNGVPFVYDIGVPEVFYEWHNGSTNSYINIDQSGTYSVTVSDDQGCSLEESAEVLFVDLSVNTEVQNITCAGMSDGSITALPEGGSEPYSYVWDVTPQQTGHTADNLSAGQYYVTVYENNGCSMSATALVVDPESFYGNISISQYISCYGDSDGAITVVAEGGTEPYQYSWSANAGTQSGTTATGLVAGSYHVTVTDSNDCILELTTILDQPTLLDATAEPTSNFSGYNVSCSGNSDGAAIIYASGGTSPYYYQWSPAAGNQTSQIASNIGAGLFYATVTDANNCTTEVEVELSEPPAVEVSVQTSEALCFGETGNAEVTVEGGVSPFSIIWENSTSNFYIDNIPAGIPYGYTITDGNNCDHEGSITISSPPELIISYSVQDVSCYGFSDGMIEIDVSGSTPPYHVDWNTGESNVLVLDDQSTGNYSVTVTDLNGCVKDENFFIDEPENELDIDYTLRHVKCYGNNEGEIQFSATGGTSPYALSVSSLNYTAPGRSHEELYSDQYTLNVTDANSCIFSRTVFISQPEPLELSVFAERPSCRGNNDGYIEFSATGGVPPYQYWFNDDRTSQLLYSGLRRGEFSVKVSDAYDCTYTANNIELRDMPVDCIVVPNAFTPNGSGINDTWIIENIEMFPDATIDVFNRWGQGVHHSRGNDEPWDGKYKNKVVPTGTYLYTIDLRNGMKPYTGTVTVIH